jgi:adenine-specific DNA-methyltransferase
MRIPKTWKAENRCSVFNGDCKNLLKSLPDESVNLVLSSPPYCMGKVYEKNTKPEEFITDHQQVLPEIVRVLKPGGSLCWQVGYHVKSGLVTPLDFVVYSIMQQFPEMMLRNRIIWTFGHGFHAPDRFSGRHETLLWFTKGLDSVFNLDAIRVPQKYPGKKHYKGSKSGDYSGNPLGKNPSDVWDIPNVKANHVEKTEHPCQFPLALALRVVRALSSENDLVLDVLDPYVGSGTTAAASIIENRRFVGAEIDKKYYQTAIKRIGDAQNGTLCYRPDGVPVYTPPEGTPLTTIPKSWQKPPQKKPAHSQQKKP